LDFSELRLVRRWRNWGRPKAARARKDTRAQGLFEPFRQARNRLLIVKKSLSRGDPVFVLLCRSLSLPASPSRRRRTRFSPRVVQFPIGDVNNPSSRARYYKDGEDGCLGDSVVETGVDALSQSKKVRLVAQESEILR
jgi:hypothetical protein